MITLVLGGVRSGKSELAERLIAADDRPVTYAATAPDDPTMEERIDRHRARRPDHWVTRVVRESQLLELLSDATGPVLVDSLGTWLVGHRDFDADVDGLVAVLGRRGGDTMLVTEEVGLSIHPETEGGRRFQDRLGELNRHVSAVADRSLLVVAGRVLELGPSIEDFR